MALLRAGGRADGRSVGTGAKVFSALSDKDAGVSYEVDPDYLEHARLQALDERGPARGEAQLYWSKPSSKARQRRGESGVES